MRLALFALIAAISTGSCARDRATLDKRDPNPSSSPSGVTFEIKNLSWTDKSGPTFWDYSGHAVVVTKEPSLQQGATMLALQYRATPPSTLDSEQNWVDTGGLITDGSGDVTLRIYYDKSRYKENPGPPKLEWRVQGFLRLSPARVTVVQ